MLLKLPLCFYILLYKTIHSFVQKIALFCTKEIILLYKDVIKSRMLFLNVRLLFANSSPGFDFSRNELTVS
jgi:hypothetical protein